MPVEGVGVEKGRRASCLSGGFKGCTVVYYVDNIKKGPCSREKEMKAILHIFKTFLNVHFLPNMNF